MILTGNQIQAELGKNIVIEPFHKEMLNPNSYNLRLHDELLVYEEIVLDMRRPNRYRRYVIPPEGLVLQPRQLYLGRTMERTETHNLVPMLEGRSSIGRLGLFVHVTAGFGDVGGDAIGHRDIDSKTLRAHQRLAGGFQQNTFVDWLGRHGRS